MGGEIGRDMLYAHCTDIEVGVNGGFVVRPLPSVTVARCGNCDRRGAERVAVMKLRRRRVRESVKSSEGNF